MKLHFRVDGPSNGVPLVLLNGLFADLHSWDSAMPMLEGFRVLRYDGRGQGLSEAPEGIYHLATLLDDCLEILEQTSFPKAHFVGISNGGCLALALAAIHPQKVLKVIAADCYHRVSPLLRHKIQSWLVAHEVGGPAHRFDIATPWIWSNRALSQSAAMITVFREKAASHRDQAVRGLLQGALGHEIDVHSIQAETLLLAGEEDLLTPPFEMKAMAKLIPASTFQTIPGAHASLLEHPQIFADTLVPFLTRGCHVG